VATLVAAPAQVVNYYFPVEVEVIGAGGAEALAERIYDALQRELREVSRMDRRHPCRVGLHRPKSAAVPCRAGISADEARRQCR
jgi:hypothetical protein